MTPLNRKLLRDLWLLRGQVLAIALVLAAGVATFVMFLATLASLELSRDSFYRNYRFADVFAAVERAPERLRERMAAIPGVNHVDTRVVTYITIDIAGFPEPVAGLITSVPDQGEPLLNKLYLLAGRSVESGREDEVVVSEAFAQAHGFRPGDTLSVIIRGKRKRLTIVGTAVSPEYVHQLRPGGVFPDYERFGVMWMARTPLAAANDMEGAFNHVVLSLAPHARAEAVIERLDPLLDRYGGSGAVAREFQPSHRFLAQEFAGLRNLTGIFPVIFMGVAAFLLNVVVNRLVSTQRDQIATLKAFGYSNREVALHYFKLVMAIVLLGDLLGLLAGASLGYWLSNIYQGLFRLPYLLFTLAPAVVVDAVLISAAAALLGTAFAVRAAARLRPAEALRPEPPASYHITLLERLGLQRLISQRTRMLLRHLGHHPGKSGLAVLGIAFAVGILMTGRFQGDSVTHAMYLQYGLGQREDISLMFVEPTSRRALYALTALPGVEYGEVFRWVPVRYTHEHRSYRSGILGLEPQGDLRRVFDEEAPRPVELPAAGLLLTDYLGEILGVRAGDTVTVEFLDGHRALRQVPVVALVPQLLGLSGFMQLEALNRLMLEGDTIQGVNIAIDQGFEAAIYAELKNIPRISGIAIREHEIENFHRTMDETMLFFTFVATVFASVIALGIVYNAARIALTERSRDLASLRVLGFTRGEIAYILLGELAVLTIAAIPLGLLIGWGLCWYIARTLDNELYRVALVIEPDTYAFAVTVVLLASLLSALVVRRRLDRLDLVGVLKTRE